MNFKELSQLEIRKPYTVQNLFNENFCVNFLTVNDRKTLDDSFLIEGESFSLYSFEDGSFVFDKSSEDIFSMVKETFNELFENKKTVFLSTVSFNTEDELTLSVMEDEKDRVLMAGYVSVLFNIIFSKYGMKVSYAAFHSEQESEEGTEYPHMHFILSSENDNEALKQFFEDFSENIEDE